MTARSDPTPALAEAITALGRAGLGPAEIACALGWTRAELAARATLWPDIAAALAAAADAALAWWEAQARRWVQAARTANAALWGRAMAGRFAGEGYAPAGRAAAPAPEPPRGPEITDERRAKVLCVLMAKTYGKPWSDRILSAVADAEAHPDTTKFGFLKAYPTMARWTAAQAASDSSSQSQQPPRSEKNTG